MTRECEISIGCAKLSASAAQCSSAHQDITTWPPLAEAAAPSREVQFEMLRFLVFATSLVLVLSPGHPFPTKAEFQKLQLSFTVNLPADPKAQRRRRSYSYTQWPGIRWLVQLASWNIRGDQLRETLWKLCQVESYIRQATLPPLRPELTIIIWHA